MSQENEVKTITHNNEPIEISVPYWWKIGGRWIARWALPWDHQESEYSYIKSVLKLKPEDYGVHKNQEEYERFKKMTHEELIQECMNLTDLIRSAEKAGLL